MIRIRCGRSGLRQPPLSPVCRTPVKDRPTITANTWEVASVLVTVRSRSTHGREGLASQMCGGRLLATTEADVGGIRQETVGGQPYSCLLYTSPSPRDGLLSRMPSS